LNGVLSSTPTSTDSCSLSSAATTMASPVIDDEAESGGTADASPAAGSGVAGYNDFLDSDDEEQNSKLSPAEKQANKLKSTWSLNCISKTTKKDPLGNEYKEWTCLHCGTAFKGWNATKVTYHLAKEKGADIRPCTGVQSKEERELYNVLFKQHANKKKAKNNAKEGLNREIESKQAQTVAAWREQSSRRAKHRRIGSIGSVASKQSNQSTSHQTKIAVDAPNPDAASDLTIAIADFIYSEGLPFSLVESPKLQRILTCAKLASSTYIPPSRKEIGDTLLTETYEVHIKIQDNNLCKDADVFGLCLFGDGATVKRMPLINILASGAHLPAAVLEIVNCQHHLAEGGKKSAEYIAELFKPHMERLDPHKQRVDLLYFDGASNVQKAGRILQEYYPRVTCLHGAEHVVSLIFQDICKMPEVKLLIHTYRKIYAWFGSGAHHKPYAAFKKHATKINRNKPIGLLRAADTRMAGHIIALLRLLRLQKALVATVTDSTLVDLPAAERVPPAFTNLFLDETFWNTIKALCRALYPVLRLLRLCDTKEPAMDKLYYFTKLVKSRLTGPEADSLDKFAIDKPYGNTAYSAMVNYFAKGKVTTIPFSYTRAPGDKDLEVADEPGEVEDEPTSEEPMEDCLDDDPYSDITSWRDYNQRISCVRQIGSPLTLSKRLKLIFNRRKDKLVTDYAITAWYLSPVPAIRADVRATQDQSELRPRVERQVVKLLLPSDPTEAECDTLLHKFWTEFEHFSSKTGPFAAHRPGVWNSPDLHQNASHMWHKMYSLPYTTTLGRVACITTSKILGIGSAERAWGDVKHLKTNKRSHLSADAVMKQSTLYGASCATKAAMRKKVRADSGSPGIDPMSGWDEADLKAAGLDQFGVDLSILDTIQAAPSRSIKTYPEDWECDHLLDRKNTIIRARYLNKFGGIMLWDHVENRGLTIHSKNMHFSNHRSRKGWCVIACTDKFNYDLPPDHEDNAPEWEPYLCGPQQTDLYHAIRRYYRKFPDPELLMLNRDEDIEQDKIDDPDYFRDTGEEPDANGDSDASTHLEEEPHPPTP